MCKDCVITIEPERGSFCATTSCYLLNFKGCAACNQKVMPITIDEVKEETEEEETLIYKHVCGACNHVICEHNWNFKVEGDYQEYEMDCMLCGTGQSSHSIKPFDPKKINEYSNY